LRRPRSAHPPCPAEGLEGQQPEQLTNVLAVYKRLKADFDRKGNKKVSIPDPDRSRRPVGIKTVSEAVGTEG
jgi:catalase-peroxidase